MQNPFRFDNKEKRFLLFSSCIIMLISCLPYFYGWFLQNEHCRFVWMIMNTLDQNTYFSYMKQAAQGYWLFTNKFSSEHTAYLLFNPFLLFLGLLSKIIPAALVYQGARVILGLAFLFLLYRFSALFFVDISQRKWTFLISATVSGLGWFYFLIKRLSPSVFPYLKPTFTTSAFNVPIDFVWAEAYTFFSIYIYPHFTIGLILMVAILLYYWDYVCTKRRKPLVYSALLTLLLGTIHGYDVITIYAAIGLFTLFTIIQDKNVSRLIFDYLLFFSLSIASTLYNFYLSRYTIFSSFGKWLMNPPGLFIFLLLGYGLVSIFAFYYLAGFLREQSKLPAHKWDRKIIFLLCWIIASLALVYLPIMPAQRRRFIMGIHIPLGILCSMGIFKLLDAKWPKKFHRPILIFILIFGSLSNIVLLLKQSLYIESYFLPTHAISAFYYLEKNSHPEQVVLTNEDWGAFLPGFSGNTIVWGHYALTENKRMKGRLFKRFLAQPDSKESQNFIRQYHVDYLLVSKEENFKAPPYLQVCYENDGVFIYKIIH